MVWASITKTISKSKYSVGHIVAMALSTEKHEFNYNCVEKAKIETKGPEMFCLQKRKALVEVV